MAKQNYLPRYVGTMHQYFLLRDVIFFTTKEM